MSTIALSVSLGRYARSLLRSGLLGTLLADPQTRIAIFSPGVGDPRFVEEFQREGRVSFFPLVEEAIGRSVWERALWKVCRMSTRNAALYRAATGLRRGMYRLMRPAHYREVFESLRPRLLVAASAGFSTTRDVPVIREAKAAGIPTLYVVHSWDNLTGLKGLMLECPDHLAVWNEIMKRQAISTYHYAPERVEVVGALQMDHYGDPATFRPRAEFLSSLGLDPARPVITVATGMPELDCAFLIRRMVELLREGRFAGRPQLICRPHPLERHRYQELESPDLLFDRFTQISNGLGWNPTLAESIHVANLIRHSAVVVNIASTVTIEACLADTPVVNVAFDPAHPELFRKIIDEDHWRRHFEVVADTGATWVARDEESLVAGINRFLEDPRLQKEERRRLAQRVCGPCDGKTHQRVAALVRRLTDRR